MKRIALFQYAALAGPLAFAGMPLYIHAPDYYATQFGVSLSQMGAVLLGLRLFDAVQDPWIGWCSDRLRRYRGGLVVASAALLALSFAALFRPAPGSALAWFLVSMLLATTAFSVLTINLNALGGLWGQTPRSRTTITATREGCAIVGLSLAVILPPALQQHYSAQTAFSLLAALLLVLLLPAVLLFLSWYRRDGMLVEAGVPVAARVGWREQWRRMPAETRFFYLVCGLSMLASALPAVLVLFFIRDRLGGEAYAGLFLLLYFGAGAAGMPAWKRISHSLGKLRTWRYAMWLAIASFGWAVFLGHGDYWQYALVCVISGLAFGAELAIPPSILADHLQRHALQAQASMQFSLMTLLLKLAAALASVLAFVPLDLAGLRPAADNAPAALLALSLTYALVPCLIKVLALLLLYRMGDDDAKSLGDLDHGRGHYA